MKKIIFSILAIALATVACSTSDFSPTAVLPTPTTDSSQVNDSPTQTEAAPATPTVARPTKTLTPAVTVEEATSTTESNLTTTPATSTNVPEISTSGASTLTPTLGVLTYGTLPPAVPFSKVTLINKSKAQAYISLQNYPVNGEVAILEYPVGKRVGVKAPLGYYIYVVWVGGKKITGSFTLEKNEDRTITIYKDKVVIQ